MSEPRGHDVDPQALLAIVDCRRLGETNHRVFRSGIGSMTNFAALQSIDRRQVNDRAGAGAKHRGDLELHAEPETAEVSLHHLVPLLLLNICEGRQGGAEDSSVVHGAVETAI